MMMPLISETIIKRLKRGDDIFCGSFFFDISLSKVDINEEGIFKKKRQLFKGGLWKISPSSTMSLLS